jgi:hypothetical protein
MENSKYGTTAEALIWCYRLKSAPKYSVLLSLVGEDGLYVVTLLLAIATINEISYSLDGQTNPDLLQYRDVVSTSGICSSCSQI